MESGIISPGIECAVVSFAGSSRQVRTWPSAKLSNGATTVLVSGISGKSIVVIGYAPLATKFSTAFNFTDGVKDSPIVTIDITNSIVFDTVREYYRTAPGNDLSAVVGANDVYLWLSYVFV